MEKNKKKKRIIRTILIILPVIVLLAVFTPLFGRPLVVYGNFNDTNKDTFMKTSDVTKIENWDPDLYNTSYIRYCPNLEEIAIAPAPGKKYVNSYFLANSHMTSAYFNGCLMDDWSKLNNCKALQDLYIRNSNFTKISDISDLKNLQKLSIWDNDAQIDLSGISSFTSMKELEIASTNGAASLLPLKECESLEVVDLYGYDYSDISVLTEMPNLKKITVRYNWTALNNCKGLESFGICSANFSKISDISGLTDLQELKIWGNREPIDLSGIGSFTSLKTLLIEGNSDISDYDTTEIKLSLAPLAECTSLEEIHLFYYDFTDTSVLTELPNLKKLTIKDGILSEKEIYHLLEKGIEVNVR